MSTIAVIDYGMGNLHSLAKALERAASEMRVEVSYDPEKLAKADRLVLPGVGGVRQCMSELHRLELNDFVRSIAGEIPLLGVCLGMQVLLDFSEENNGVDALGVFPGDVRHFADTRINGRRRKVPHMGWNQVRFERSHPLCRNLPDESWFYFVHSYYAHPDREEHVLGTTEYGGERFCSMMLRDGVFATQFHPEKSQGAGMQMLVNFVNWDGEA